MTSFRPAPHVAAKLDELPTEAWDPEAADLDLRSTRELVALMNARGRDRARRRRRRRRRDRGGDRRDRAPSQAGGRLVYVGAGTSGRLALVDAAECESTFSAPPGLVTALIAGGAASAATAQEHAEDDADGGSARAASSSASARMTRSSASARAAGRPTSSEHSQRRRGPGRSRWPSSPSRAPSSAALAEHEIAVVVGAEVIAGSTRLKAGTAQKLVLNMISTIAMVRLGKTFGNLMVDVVATNEKLRARVRRIVRSATGEPAERVEAALDAADGDAKVAIVSLLAGVDADDGAGAARGGGRRRAEGARP